MNSSERPACRSAAQISRMNPELIAPSAWCQPDECEYHDSKFESLRKSMTDWGGNLQPIKIRTIREIKPGGDMDVTPRTTTSIEIVYGHARLQACLELGVPVLVLSEELSDVEALQEYTVEVRGDGRWRPWRLGRLFHFAMNSGMFPTLRRAANTLFVPVSEAALALEMGRLPDSIRRAYRNLELSPVHCKRLVRAYSENPEVIDLNSRECTFRECSTAAAVFAALTKGAK